jgi:hypothetical protein
LEVFFHLRRQGVWAPARGRGGGRKLTIVHFHGIMITDEY